MNTSPASEYTVSEEIANAITHAIGAMFGVVALMLMLLNPSTLNDVETIVAVSIYGGSMIILYSASALYHSMPHYRAKKVFKVVDHACIYLLIAGSYTPYLMVTLGQTFDYVILFLVWGIALIGVIFKIFAGGRFPKISVISYLAMGWISLFIINRLMYSLDDGGLWLLALGGVVYSLGVIFYLADDKIPFNHAIWHLFVLGGTVLHFCSIYIYVIPDTPAWLQMCLGA